MKVLHISPRLSPGGIKQLAADLATGMQQAGFKNTVISPPNELVGRLAAASVQHHRMRNIHIFSYRGEIKRIRRIAQSSQADVILTYTTQATYLAWLACKSIPEEERPHIIGIHATYPRYRGWKLSLECCDALIATSRHLRDELIRRAKIDAERHIWVVPYGINEDLCHPAYKPSAEWLEQWKRTHPESADTFKICMAGGITPLHGHEDIPAILSLLTSASIKSHLYIVGDTARADHKYHASIRNKLKQNNQEQMVTWLGSQSELRDIISVCDVLISLTRQPPCHDRAVLEALSLGKPVAGYDHGIVGEILDTYLPEGRVAPGNKAGIVDKLEQWHAYRPVFDGSLLYPFRLTDTIKGVSKLCAAVCQTRPTTPHH